LFPSGSMIEANFPYSESSFFSSMLQPSSLVFHPVVDHEGISARSKVIASLRDPWQAQVFWLGQSVSATQPSFVQEEPAGPPPFTQRPFSPVAAQSPSLSQAKLEPVGQSLEQEMFPGAGGSVHSALFGRWLSGAAGSFALLQLISAATRRLTGPHHGRERSHSSAVASIESRIVDVE
jgi:hypothetical protein